MGNKFCNLNIYSAAPIEITLNIPGIHTYRCSSKWITVTSPAFEWGNTQEFAKDLSKSLSCPVLSTEYFDDDFVQFTLCHSGKTVTKHIPVEYEDMKKKKGNAAKIIQCLSLNILEEPALKKVLCVSDCEESVHLLESFLGCPIFGVMADCPPIDAPDRTLFYSFIGGRTNVSLKLKYNPARPDLPPYTMQPDTVFIEKTILHETIICFTDKSDPIIRKIEQWLKVLREDKEQGFHDGTGERSDVLKEYDVQIVIKRNRVIIQGLNYGARGVDVLSREFKSLVFVTDLGSNGFSRMLECAMGYGGKRLFSGHRGSLLGWSAPEVIPNVCLESPYLSLSDGQLVTSFEADTIQNAVSALEKLLDAPILPIVPETYKIIKNGDHMRVFELK